MEKQSAVRTAFQPQNFTSYTRDGNHSDEAMFRRHNRWWSRFDQPDPYDGSYNPTDPQSFNRYAYVQNDPVNFVDPLGLDGTDSPPDCGPGYTPMRDAEGKWQCVGVGVHEVNSLPHDPFWDQFDASYSKPLDWSWMFMLQTSPGPTVGSTVIAQQTPQNSANQPQTAQKQQSRKDCIRDAIAKYLIKEGTTGFKRVAANAVMGTLVVTSFFLWSEVGAAGAALGAGEITVLPAGMQAIHAAGHAGLHAGAAAAAGAYWGYTFKESYENNKEFRRAVDACPKS